MGKKSSPKPPDPYKTAEAQSQANKEAILTSALVNRYDTETPWGAVTWERPSQQRPAYTGYPSKYGFGNLSSRGFPGDTSAEGLAGWKQKISLSDPIQRQFDQENQKNIALGDLAINRIGQIDKGAFSLDGLPELNKDFSGDADKVEKATYDRLIQLMSPQMAERERALDNRLSVMGLPVGGEAYSTEKDRYDRMRNEAELSAALEAVTAGRSEQSRLFDMSKQARQQGISDRVLERQQPINELAMVLGQVPGLKTPQAPQTAQYQAAAPDISGMIQNQYNTKSANQAAKKGGTSSMLGSLGSAAILASDRRLKQNISQIGRFKDYNLYRYEYEWDLEPRIGVMADEVEQINPGAVITMDNGYKAVAYGAL